MNKLLTDNRAANILRLLGTRSGMTVAELAAQLQVRIIPFGSGEDLINIVFGEEV